MKVFSGAFRRWCGLVATFAYGFRPRVEGFSEACTVDGRNP